MAAAVSKRLGAVWLLLLALVAGIVVIERRDISASGGEEDGHGVPSGDRRLLPAPMAELGAIEIAYGGAMHRFERDSKGVWFYHAHATNAQDPNHVHQADAAIAQRIDKAFAGFENARREREFANDASANFGVNAPEMFIVIYARDGGAQPLARYSMGALAPDNFSRYVLPAGSAKVYTVATYQFDNLVALIKDMQATPQG